MKYYFKKTFKGLIPMQDCKVYNNLEIGQEIEIDITNKRNAKFHRKFFALINLAFENQEQYKDLEDLRKDLIIVAGYNYTRVNYITGEETIEAKSISFSSMDETEFEVLYNKVLSAVAEFLEARNEDIINELGNF